MGYISVMSPCFACRQVMTYNPNFVPSLTFKDGKQVPPGTPGATKEPFCRSCIERANVTRITNGLQPIVPHPNAYEPEPEENVPFE